MITNERQYKITKAALGKLKESIESFQMQKTHAAIGNEILAKAQLDALESEREILADQIKEYEILKSSSIENFRTESLHELPSLLVKARIAAGLSQRELADRLGLKEQQVQRYEAEKYGTASLRRILEIADALGLYVSEPSRLTANTTTKGPNRSNLKLDCTLFPIKEMYRRGWFAGFTGSQQEAEAEAQHLLADYVSIARASAIPAFHRTHVRSRSVLNEYALFAWECRVLWLAQQDKVIAAFTKSTMTTDWIRDLSRLSARKNGAVLAKEYLRDSGITLVIEPHLPQTYLDGAAFLLSANRPIIGMTLRYDRTDNFWFVLFHELAHLQLHCRTGGFRTFFDDLDAGADEVETQADEFANEALIPSAIWETAVPRYLRTTESVTDFAAKVGIGPSVIAGRIRKEANNYVILNELVGVGEVRRQFSEVAFGL